MILSHLDFLRARAVQAREEGQADAHDHVRDRRKAEAGEAADMLRERATECRGLSSRSHTQAAKAAFRLLADQLDRQAVEMVTPGRQSPLDPT